MSKFNFAFWTWFEKDESMQYPGDFGIIDYSPIAKELGVKGDRNKIIFRYFINRYGNIDLRKYRYSEARVFTLQKLHKIPIFDKTKQKTLFPVFARILPGEVQFVTK